jgi:hypothetical protein
MNVAAGILLALGGAGTLLSLVVVHVLPTGLNPLRDPVSQYGITRYRGWYRAAAISAAVAGVGGALLFAGFEGVVAIVTVVLLAVFAAARGLIGFFPMDAPDAMPTATGRVHNLLALAAFAPVTAGAFTGAGALHDAGYATASALSTVCAVVMVVGTIGMIVAAAPRLRGLFGFAERLIYAGFIAWFGILAVTAPT